MSTPWETDKWFVSLWDYLDEGKKEFSFPEKVIFHDTTLRDGEQQAGVIFTKGDKVAIAEKLAGVGVHRIEAGLPAVSAQDEAAIKEIVKRNLGPEIFSFSRCMPDDVKRAADCGVDGVVVEIPTSQHTIQKAYRWPLEKVLGSAIKNNRSRQGVRAQDGVLSYRRQPGGDRLVPGFDKENSHSRTHGLAGSS